MSVEETKSQLLSTCSEDTAQFLEATRNLV